MQFSRFKVYAKLVEGL